MMKIAVEIGTGTIQVIQKQDFFSSRIHFSPGLLPLAKILLPTRILAGIQEEIFFWAGSQQGQISRQDSC